MNPIYLDHNSTTPVDPKVLKAMIPYFSEKFGNAASRNHNFGMTSMEAVKEARQQIASLINASKHEVVFTSGATESINLAIKGFVDNNSSTGKHIIVPKTEHKAVLDTCETLVYKGFDVTYLDVQGSGIIDIEELKSQINEQTILIAVMHANNEIGVLQPIKEIGMLCNKHNLAFFVDAAQSFGKEDVNVKDCNIDFLSASGHKIYGPKGIGILYVNKDKDQLSIKPLIDGGGHEGGLRSGTLNVPGIVGFGEAANIASKQMVSDRTRELGLRNRFIEKLTAQIDNFYINGDLTHRLAGNINVSFDGVNGDALLLNMDDIAVSNGAACSSTVKEPSYVLQAIGRTKELAEASLRIGIGRDTTKDNIDYAVNKISSVVKNLREIESLKSDLL